MGSDRRSACANITGKTYYEAVRILDKEGLRPAKDIREASSDAPKGEIVAQDPVANFRIKSYQPVTITVSIGAELAPVPSVIGKSQDAAAETLRTGAFVQIGSRKSILKLIYKAQSSRKPRQRAAANNAAVLLTSW